MLPIFLTFDYERDHWRAGRVRRWGLGLQLELAGFLDQDSWEELDEECERPVQEWIEEQLEGTSVTVVLVGSQTYSREYVNLAIARSHELGKGLLAIRIHRLQNQWGETDYEGMHPFDRWWDIVDDEKVFFSKLYRSYDWKEDQGEENFRGWVEEAERGRV